MAELIDYVRKLADEIGPRPATTDSEHRAAEWLATSFGTHGLETEVHEFDAPRTYSWAYALYHLFTIAAAIIAGPLVLDSRLVWPAFALAAITAFFFYSDLDARWGLTRLMPKGPSQNVIARHVPRSRRGDRLRRIVVISHYDSARSSLLFSPGAVKGFATSVALTKASTFLVPALILAIALPIPWPSDVNRWLWYAALVVAAYLLVPLFVNIHREVFMPFTAGANDNASGVAVLLGAMARLVPAADATSLVTGSFPALRRGPEAAHDAGVVPEGAELSYTPAGPTEAAPLPDDFEWAAPVAETRGQGLLDFDTIDFAAVGPDRPRSRRDDAERPYEPVDEGEGDSGRLPADIASLGPEEAEQEERRRLFGSRGGRRKQKQSDEDVTDWLGVNGGFDARKAGADIGSWDNFDSEDDDPDGLGWKGGWAGDDPIEDPEFAAHEAARIRRRITESVDRELTEKEIWFVATGAKESGTWGMQALLRDYAEELRDALIINVDNVGAGQLYWISAEGMARRYRSNQRLVGLARRVSRETETVIKPRVFKGVSTDASLALARGLKAITIMALGPDDLPVNWHWKTDTTDNVDAELLETAADFIAGMVREA